MKTAKNDGTSKAAAAAAEDDEVEEFYAILRRIRVAVKYFEKGNAEGGGAGRNLTAEKPWNSYFRQEDFKQVVDGVKERESVEDNAGLDLNADPRLLVFYFSLPCEDLSDVYDISDQSHDEENFRC
ncbi:hypothetical protein HAX54_044660 [Datura stramonium]|uniref:Uncharacterized protein n=1 Tax=Datura stramonium TaxID=4076 RepID=A0ABS8WEV5_DATST|nr:hypothetical protein [Datura stramonium]